MRPLGTDLILWNTSVFIFPHLRVGILWCYADSMLLPPVDNHFVYDPPTCPKVRYLSAVALQARHLFKTDFFQT